MGSQFILLVIICLICSCVKNRQRAYELQEEKEKNRIWAEEPHSAPPRMSGKRLNLLINTSPESDKEMIGIKRKISTENEFQTDLNLQIATLQSLTPNKKADKRIKIIKERENTEKINDLLGKISISQE